MPETIRVEYAGPVARVILDRPSVHNAFDDVMIEELHTAFSDANEQSELRVIVLGGEGKSFSAGADMNWMRRMKDYSRKENKADSMKMAAMFQAMRQCEKPIIGRVHGAVIGGGTGLVAACDLAIATSQAVFGFSEVRLGLIPAVISPWIIERIGITAAKRYMLTGDRFDAIEAGRMGLIAQVVENEETLDLCIEKATDSVLRSGPQAVAACKKLIHDVSATRVEDLLHDVAQRIAELRVGNEGQNGLTAFLEKRPPNWTN